MSSEQHIRALIVEDSEDDAMLLVRELQRSGYAVDHQRVDEFGELEKSIAGRQWDIIFCDFSLPHITGTDVLRFIRSKDPDVPFIFVSGTMGEDIAVSAMRSGAQDYLTKGNLKRLAPAVDRELREAEIRREHRRSSDALDAAHAQLKHLFDTLDEEFFSFDVANNRLLLISPACEKIYGIPPEEFLRNPRVWHDAVHPDDKANVDLLHPDLLKGKSVTQVHRIIRKDGETRWLEARVKPACDPHGRLVRLDGVVTDITERKRAEVLQNAIYRIAQADDVAPTLAVLFRSVHQIVLEVMPAQNFAVALLGESPGDIRFAYFADERFDHPEPGGTNDTLTRLVIRTGKSLLCDAITHQRLIAQAAIPPADMSSAVWLGVPLIIDRKVIGAIAIHHYTQPNAFTAREQLILEYVCLELAKAIQRKQGEEKLRRNEEQLRLIAENIADLIVVFDTDGRRIYASPLYTEIIGTAGSGESDDGFAEIEEDDRERIRDLFRAIRDDGSARREEFRIRAADGTERYLDSQWSTVRDADGAIDQVIAVSRDITEQKALEQQMLRSQRMESIGTLAGGIAHDLNNVLAPIMMAIDLLKRQFANPATDPILDTLEASANRGASIVKQVLTFARGVAGERIDLQPAHIIREIEKIVRQTFPKSIDILVDLPKGLWPITGDPTQIHQVLLNLCVNARDAMPGGGQLRIDAANVELDEHYAHMHPEAHSGPYIMVGVADTGTGIPPELLGKIFEPFFTTKEIGRGTGLGLSTVQAIVRSHGGLLNVYSEPGKGSRFTIYFPAQPNASHLTESGTQTAHPMGAGELILVVDDEASIREITKETLESHNYRVVTAADGAEAISLYVQRMDDIRLVITDMMMPYMDGIATIRALQKVNPEVRIIAASGLAHEIGSMQEIGLRIGGFLTKPYTAGMLLNLIHRVLTDRHASE